jgi:addiction module HigA family antidote
MVGFEMTNSGETLHPGRILLSQAMEPLGISRNQLARDIDVPVGRISDITNGKRGVTADTALRLGRYFGTGPELWLRLQAEFDLYVARKTTWPAVESRVRILTSEAPLVASAEAPVAAPVEMQADDMPAVDEAAIENDVFVGTDPEPLAEALGEESGSNSDDPETSVDPGIRTAELLDQPVIDTEPERLDEESDDNETSMSSPQAIEGGLITDDVDRKPDDNPDPFIDRDAELGIPPIPDRTKLYQSG